MDAIFWKSARVKKYLKQGGVLLDGRYKARAEKK